MSKIVIIFLTLGMLLIAFFTYQTHLNAISSYRRASETDRAQAAYDYVDLQIRNAYQQTLLSDLTRAQANMGDYFESEERIYRVLSEIDTITSGIGVDSLPSDSLRPLVSRQFLRIERFRLRGDRSNDSLTTAMLNASLEDQQRINELIRGDKRKLENYAVTIRESGILTPVFIFFLFAFGSGIFIYAYTALQRTRNEISGIEDKLRKNQEILNTELKEHEQLKQMHKQMLDLSDELWLILEPVYEHGEAVDFQIRHANEKAEDYFIIGQESSIQKIFTSRFDRDETDELLSWILDCYESRESDSKELDLQIGGTRTDMAMHVVPNEKFVYLRALDLTNTRNLEFSSGGFRQEANILFDLPGLVVAELDPQGRVLKGNNNFNAAYGDPAKNYIWELLKPGDDSFKNDLRNQIHLLPESDFKLKDKQYAIYGIRNEKGLIGKVVFITNPA